jgi:hypothetical protein
MEARFPVVWSRRIAAALSLLLLVVDASAIRPQQHLLHPNQ